MSKLIEKGLFKALLNKQPVLHQKKGAINRGNDLRRSDARRHN